MKKKVVLFATCAIVVSFHGWCDLLNGRVILEVGLLQKDVVEEYARSNVKHIGFVKKVMYNDLLKSGLQPRQYVAHAHVEIQSLIDMKTVAQGTTDANGRFSIEVHNEPASLRVYSVAKMLVGDKHLRFEGVCPVVRWKDKELNVYLRRETISLVGRCLNKNKMPEHGVYVRVNQYPGAESSDMRLIYPQMLGVSDTNGYWRVDGLSGPTLEEVSVHLCDTNSIHFMSDMLRGTALVAGIECRRHAFGGSPLLSFEQSLITADLRAAAIKYRSLAEKKTGKIWKQKAPMTIFPVSTNNTIYIKDIILP